MRKDQAQKGESSSEEHAPNRATSITCPFCGSTETEQVSQFGSMLMSSQHYCHGCRTIFDRVRWDRP